MLGAGNITNPYQLDALATKNRRRGLFFFLYICEGAPFGLIWWMLPVLLREAELSVEKITGLTAAATIPWTLKFLVAPLVDYSSTRGFALRYWISISQIGMCLVLLPLFGKTPGSDYVLLFWCLIAHSSLAAMQDVAVDTLAIRSTPTTEMGVLNGWMQAGMLAGRATVAGLGLILVEKLGFDAILLTLIGLLGLSALSMPAFLRSEPVPESTATPSVFPELIAIGKTSLFWLAAGFALIAGAAFEGFGAIAGPLFADLSYDKTTIARIFGGISPIAMVIGALTGGAMADHFGRLRVCGALVVIVAILVPATSMLPSQEPRAFGTAILIAYYLAVGMLTGVTYSLFMELASRSAIAATQFSVFMALTNACEAWSAWTVGILVTQLDYGPSLWIMTLLSLPALILLRAIRRSP